jgi:FkbM family methyltransferase
MPSPRIGSKRSLASSLLSIVNRCTRLVGVELSGYPAPTTLDWHIKTLLNYQNINCVLDVGANHGQFAQRLRHLGYRGWILSFEPVPSVFEALSHRLRDDRFWHGFQIALGDREETRPFHVARGDAQASSFLEFNEAGPKRWGDDHTVGETISMRVRRLDEVWEECTKTIEATIDAPRVLLKMDCQGYDLNVVEGGSGIMANVFAIQSELALEHYYERMTHFSDAVEAYEKLGFDAVGFFPIARREPDYLRVVEMDCLFLKHPNEQASP